MTDFIRRAYSNQIHPEANSLKDQSSPKIWAHQAGGLVGFLPENTWLSIESVSCPSPMGSLI